MLKRASSEAHSLQMNMENLKIRNDKEGRNRGCQLRNSNGDVQIPDPRANNAYDLLDGQLSINENVGAIQDGEYHMGAVPLIEGKTKR